jgi:two-component system, chemotaxis family, protein-glutamate methylesterase/glutaminase
MEDIPEGCPMIRKSLSRHDMEIVVIGASAGGLGALGRLLPILPAGFPCPVAIVLHVHETQDDLSQSLCRACAMKVKEAEDKEPAEPGVCYLAPADYHLLVESDRTFSLSKDEKVNHSRPSIDVLFESAAASCGRGAVAVLLTGASRDGAGGLAAVRANGGTAVIQDPATAEHPFMPNAGLETAGADQLLEIEAIGRYLVHRAGLADSSRETL